MTGAGSITPILRPPGPPSVHDWRNVQERRLSWPEDVDFTLTSSHCYRRWHHRQTGPRGRNRPRTARLFLTDMHARDERPRSQHSAEAKQKAHYDQVGEEYERHYSDACSMEYRLRF